MNAIGTKPVRRGPAGGPAWTLATSEAWVLYWSSEALAQWTVAEAAAVLAHEVGHALRAHAARARKMGASAAAWNCAADAELNDDPELESLLPAGCWRAGPSVVEEAARLGVSPLALARAAAARRWPYLARALAALVPVERQVPAGAWPTACPGPGSCRCSRGVLPKDCGGADRGLLAEAYYRALLDEALERQAQAGARKQRSQQQNSPSARGGQRGQDASGGGAATPPSEGECGAEGGGATSPSGGGGQLGEAEASPSAPPGTGGAKGGEQGGPERPNSPSGGSGGAPAASVGAHASPGVGSGGSTGSAGEGSQGVARADTSATSGAGADSSTGDSGGDSAPEQQSAPARPVPSAHREPAGAGGGRCCAGGSACTGQPAPWELPEDAEVGRSEAEREQVRAEVAKAVREAKQAAKGRGKVPGGWAVWADEWEAGRQAAQAEARRWERQLRAYLGRELSRRRGDEAPSYARPRWAPSLASGRLVPGGVRPSARVALVLDTSGSMRGAGAEVARVVEGICRAVTGGGAEGVRVLAVDTEVHADARVTSSREVARRGLLRGGGGTDLRAGLARACEPQRGWRADVVVVVSDGDGEWPKTAPRVPVLVALVGERRRQYLPAWVRAVVEVE